MDQNFNHIKEWIVPILRERGMSIEKLARSCGLTRAAVYHYMTDKCRPESQTMKEICSVLDRPFEEGLRQYTPRKAGRPAGSRTGITATRTR